MIKLDNKGMTLVELLTAMFITVIVGAVAITFLSAVMNRYSSQISYNTQISIVHYLEEVISSEIRYASEVIISDQDIGTYSSDYNVLKITDNQVIINDEIVSNSSTFQDQQISVTFIKITSDCVDIEIMCSGDNDYTSTISIRILNMVEEVSGSRGIFIYYQ
ncbi:PilW family protein [Tannockella kyphosi]|uniref:PilW family protein n=1 Tax=Tannockella kyphosi TaxID=2899121 RepID=UPI002011EC18|nr:prepilin-type N-terminal cleavage/methylation domain-containing protein [Tannockella kyphosi]